MPGLIKTWGIALPLALWCSLGTAEPTEPAPANAEPTVVDRVGTSVKHGVGRAATATGHAVERTARKIGLPASSAPASSPQ
jgi:hypothetical protein